ncbi:hypothetical protein OH77DRAFT_1430727 [Trametes cingulata]|nr:hypothetical protein OH77DRAFT_1430727 [Trametes cingulata]
MKADEYNPYVTLGLQGAPAMEDALKWVPTVVPAATVVTLCISLATPFSCLTTCL